jgi:iron complex outermembrane receptor protein
MKSKPATPRWAWGSVSLAALLMAAPVAICAPAEPVVSFAIPGGALETALTAYATQAHVQLLYTPEVVRGRRSEGLSGAFTAKAALARLLDGTGVTAQQSRPGVIVLRIGLVADSALTVQTEVAQPAPAMLDELIVTGSNIRGVDAGPSPVVSFGRDEIDRQGFATVAETLAALPQNFSGLATPDTTSTGADTTSQNNGRATTVNLRGLGPNATLVLINGRRMAGGGGRGDLLDVSSIPTAAIQRVDVLLDGASALYGADAVGGVVNIILRRDFDGGETRARYGAARGGAEETQFAQTLGRTWDTGHVLASYEYYDRRALAFADRPYTASADLRPFGGSDWRSVNASPGNVLTTTPTGAVVPTWAIPAGATTFPLKPGDFLAGVVNLTGARQGIDILPHQRRNSVYAAASQSLGDRVDLNADLRYSQRATDGASLATTATVTIADNNPFFASPNGARSSQIGYSFIDQLGNTRSTSRVDSLGASVGADVRLWGDWRLEAFGAYAQELTRSATTGSANSLFLREAVGATADNPATTFRTAVDGFFNPYGPNSRAVLSFIGSGYSRQRYEGQTTSLNVQADGKLMHLPGGDLRLAVGLNGRRESFGQRTESFTSTATPTITRPSTYRREILAAFAELRAPLVGEDNALPGVRKLELSLAGRIERYDDVGTSSNPKVGLTWEPVQGLGLRASYGTSFRAPLLSEVYSDPLSAASFFTRGAGRILAINLTGGNRNLRPETATSWTLGADWTPVSIPDLKVSATVFDTDFKNQIDRPTTRFIQQGLDQPMIAPFVRFVNPLDPTDLAYVQGLITAPGYLSGGLYPASAIGVIVDARYVNTGRAHVRGLDLSAAYGFDRGRDRFDLTASASYLIDYELQVTPTAPTADYVNIAGQPVDFRARLGVAWRRETLGASLSVNYVDAYRSPTRQRTDAWTTLDAQFRWTPDRLNLKGVSLALSVQNLLDADPPFYNAPTGVGYDATNADPIGRYASIQLTKRW